VSSVIQIDELLQRTLPARARLKLRKLLAAAEDAQSAHMAAIQRAERLREEQALLVAEQRQAEDRARAVSDKPEAVEAAVAQFADAISQLQTELERLTPQLQQREQRRTNSARLIGALRGFLGEAASRNQPLASFNHPPPQLRADEDPVQGIRRLRGEIDQLDRELQALRRASLPTGELQQKIRDYVAELARGGMPALFTDGGQFSRGQPHPCRHAWTWLRLRHRRAVFRCPDQRLGRSGRPPQWHWIEFARAGEEGGPAPRPAADFAALGGKSDREVRGRSRPAAPGRRRSVGDPVN
jgi:hypothetical protein